MTLEELDQCLLRFGACLDRWPPTHAEAAHRLQATSPRAAERMARAAAFEDRLARALQPPPFTSVDTDRVLAHLDAETIAHWPPRGFWLAGGGLSAASLALGILVAFTMGPVPTDQTLPLSVIEIAVGHGDIGNLP